MSLRFDTVIHQFDSHREEETLVCNDRSYTFGELDQARTGWLKRLAGRGIGPGEVIGLQSEYSFNALSLFLALLSNRDVVALIPPGRQSLSSFIEAAKIDRVFKFSKTGRCSLSRTADERSSHPLIERLRRAHSAGFVVFTSGSTGRPKAALHDLDKFLIRFQGVKKRLRTLAFLRFDHIAGLDTVFYGLCTQSCLVLPQRRDVNYICEIIDRYAVQVLPASPTFLNLLCLSQAYRDHDLSSLRVIAYGSEPMSKVVLENLTKAFPNCRLIQKYGTSEFGSPRALSKGKDSLWLTFSRKDCQTRIVDNVLWIKAKGAMMGYLNAEDPFDPEGWICTGDEVEVDGEWIRILGRKTEIINVGGEKVYPAEVEEIILQVDGVSDVVVRGEPYPLMGQIVSAVVHPVGNRRERDLVSDIRRYCRQRLAPYKVPVKIRVSNQALTGHRQKKIRRVS